jgi:hypothetical protein
MISKEFILAGDAIFTVSNGRDEHYTYKVHTQPDRDRLSEQISFVYLLAGPDNQRNYIYLGIIMRGTFNLRLTNASKLGRDAKPVRVLQWALKKIWLNQSLPEGYSINHAGKCGRCGRLLTTPESIKSGIGPVCEERMIGK